MKLPCYPFNVLNLCDLVGMTYLSRVRASPNSGVTFTDIKTLEVFTTHKWV